MFAHRARAAAWVDVALERDIDVLVELMCARAAAHEHISTLSRSVVLMHKCVHVLRRMGIFPICVHALLTMSTSAPSRHKLSCGIDVFVRCCA